MYDEYVGDKLVVGDYIYVLGQTNFRNGRYEYNIIALYRTYQCAVDRMNREIEKIVAEEYDYSEEWSVESKEDCTMVISKSNMVDSHAFEVVKVRFY